MGGTCSMQGRGIHTKFLPENFKGKGHVGVLRVIGVIILKYYLERYKV
jgi:hypothetical protein